MQVADSGPGIPAELREVVFERFRQLDGGAKRRVGGTGLGLAIAREFMQLHGGSLRVDAAPEGGALFIASFPVTTQAAPEAASASVAVELTPASQARVAELMPPRRQELSANDVEAHAPLVLVVEDNPEMNDFVTEALAKTYRIARADNGRLGLERALALRPAVIVSDVMMPDMDGEELVRRARAQAELRSTQILLLTAKADAAFRVRMLREGAQDVLVKPFLVDELRARVDNLTSGRRVADLAEANAELAERFRQANLELERAYDELRATQSQLIHAAKMASLGQLVAGIAHEINNPLSFAQSHVETIRRTLELLGAELPSMASGPSGERWQRARERLDATRMGLERIRELVLKLRTFSRLDEGERKSVPVRECIESVLTLLEHRLDARISVEIGVDPGEIVDCYPALLNQALMNLVSNSIHAISGPGTIAITSRDSAEGYRIEVRDTGCGIPTDLRERVLEPFFTTRPVGEGTGLGLSITDSIMQKHGGRVEIDDADGGGTVVTLLLRRESRSTAPPASG